MNDTRHRKIIGGTIFLVAMLIGGFTLARGLYYSPGSEEVLTMNSEETNLAEADVVAGAVAGPSNGGTPAAVATVKPTSKPATTNSALPSRLVIPKLGINAHVQHLGMTSTGLMAAPKNFTDVSWYKLGTVPGQRGSAVVSGHEDNAVSLDGVFKHLEDLEAGDDVYINTGDGKKLHFRVTSKEIVPYDLSGPKLNQIFTRSDGIYLNLITCAGDWLPAAKTNDQRLIVYTKLVTS